MMQSIIGMPFLSSIVGNLLCFVISSISDCAALTTSGCLTIIFRKVAVIVAVFVRIHNAEIALILDKLTASTPAKQEIWSVRTLDLQWIEMILTHVHNRAYEFNVV